VSSWNDLSGYARHAITVETTKRPDLVRNIGPRFLTAVRFDGASHLVVPRPVEDDMTLIAAFATTSTAGGARLAWWATPGILGGDVPSCRGDYQLGLNVGKPLFTVQEVSLGSDRPLADGVPHSMMGVRLENSGDMSIFADGAPLGQLAGESGPQLCSSRLMVGSSQEGLGFWTGDLFEIVAYDHALNTVERNLVGTYLAARLGAPAPLTLYAFAATHGGDVSGIGRASAAELIEQAEGPGILQVSAPSALSDGDYLLWGTDVRATSLSTDVPLLPPAPLATGPTITDGGGATAWAPSRFASEWAGSSSSGAPRTSRCCSTTRRHWTPRERTFRSCSIRCCTRSSSASADPALLHAGPITPL
jgi:hypothetical protein